MTATPESIERERILTEFERRDREYGDYYAPDKPGNLFLRQGQERALVWALHAGGCVPLADKRLLDVGCGRGQWFAAVESLGARRENLAGIELQPERQSDAAARFAGADIRQGDAAALPWPDGAFDVVAQSTVFTSILDNRVRRQVAAEMLRVLAPQGTVLWYDFCFDNPANDQVRGIGRREVESLFPGCRARFRRVTLAPPLARRLAAASFLLAAAVESLRLLNTHLFGYLQRAA